ncbi:DUF4412 domain-containing protein [Desulfonema magnum]|uniref:DUF4412 n=1 Tax=Desulfonema magnum TaxID=45655 RepID=A0A975GPQ3_9BACT|nr:DUF4412 domain-containing protein [Desulfonema magnum]QTA89069.1 DUF4412 [Desulfonema magnum]
MKIRIFLLTVLFLGITSGAFAGWVFVEKSQGDTHTSYLQDNRMKFVAGDHLIIFDLDKNKICFADPKKKTYWMGSPEEFAAQTRKSMENIDKMMEKQLAKLPPAQREKMKSTILQQMKKHADAPLPKVEVRATDQSGKIAGYEVRKYEILFNGQLRQDQWIAKDIMVDKEVDMKRFGKMMKTFHAGIGRSAEDIAMASPKVTELMSLKGWPLKKTDYDEEGYPETDEVIKVEKKSLPPSTFDIPKGYRKLSMSEIFNGK